MVRSIQWQICIGTKRHYEYNPNNKHINIIWNISHPTEIELSEYSKYDLILIASNYWANIISNNVKKPVYVMLQCTDHELFYKPINNKNDRLLFVGNGFSEGRKTITDLLPTKYEFDLYGPNWENKIERKYLKGKIVLNKKLSHYYNRYGIVLNDHRKEMSENGFVNNRTFDVWASGGFVISNKVYNSDLFDGKFVEYDTKEDLERIIDYYLNNPRERNEYIARMQKIVLSEHTFEIRAAEIIKKMDELFSNNN